MACVPLKTGKVLYYYSQLGMQKVIRAVLLG
jgi:hypothetical protein